MLTAEKTAEEKPNNMMMGNHFFGEVTTEEKEETPKECSVVGIIKNFINDLEEKMEAADKDFSRAYHREKYSPATYEADEKCKLLEAQKKILTEVVNTIEYMITPSEKSVTY